MVYILKIWIVTVLLPPVLICLFVDGLKENGDFLGVMVLMVILGAIFSIPTMLILLAISVWLKQRRTEPAILKIIINVIAIAGIIVSFDMVLDGSDSFLPVAYSIVMTASIWLFRLPEYISEENLTQD